MKQGACILLLAACLALLPGMASAQTTLELEGTAIIGEEESPRVRFNIPWRETATTSLPKRPWRSLIRHEPEPIDRETFRLKLQLEQTAKPNETPR